MLFVHDLYNVLRCEKHKVTIYHFKKTNQYAEHGCWDCLRDRNQNGRKEDSEKDKW